MTPKQEQMDGTITAKASALHDRRVELQRKLRSAESLSDDELRSALRWYRQLAALTRPLGREFDLFHARIVTELEQMRRWQAARREQL